MNDCVLFNNAYSSLDRNTNSVIELGGFNRKLTIVNDTFLIITTDEFHWVDTLYKVTDPHLLKKLKEVPIP